MNTEKSFIVVKPDDANFEALNEMVPERGTEYYDYDTLAEAYNKAPVGTVIVIERNIAANNVKTTLEGRGLHTGLHKQKTSTPLDVSVVRPYKAGDDTTIPPEERVILIKKLTTTPMAKKKNRA